MSRNIALCYIANDIGIMLKNIVNLKDYLHEIIIIDTGLESKDRETLELLGVKVFDYGSRPFDFSIARNMMIEKATAQWILSLDDDEYMELSSFHKLQEMLSDDSSHKIYSVYIYNYYSNGLWSCYPVTRLFPRRNDVYYEKSIHESVNYSARRAGLAIETVPTAINHLGYIDLNIKNQKYNQLLKQQLQNTPEDAATWWHYGMTIASENPHEALKIMDKAIFLSPKNSMPLIFSSRINKMIHNYDDSFNKLELAEKLDTHGYWGNTINNLRGLIYMEQNKLTLAKKCFEKAIEHDDRLAHSYCNLGAVFFLEKKEVEAKRCFLEAVLLNPYLLSVSINTENRNLMSFQEDVSHAFLGIEKYI